MMRSLFSAVSGLRNHQVRMDVIGNNIANVNTTGFKASRVTFAELFSQNIRGASRPDGNRGGTNPQQIGLGVTTGSIDVVHGGGNTQPTGKGSDLSISGEGFFIIDRGGTAGYTRAGVFDFDTDGYFTTPDGYRVQGWMADANGNFGLTEAGTLTNIRLPLSTSLPARATTAAGFDGNLDADTAVGESLVKTVEVYDSLGRAQTLTLTLTKTANDNEWDWEAELDGVTVDGQIQFNPDGSFDQAVLNGGGNPAITANPAAADPLSIDIDFSALTQSAGENTIEPTRPDGYPMGELESVSIDSAGVITGSFSNGLTRQLAMVALATFVNPGGLSHTSSGIFNESNNSGAPRVGAAGTANRGTINPGSLEMSNVDLAQEFTNMIITQRGFQANSRVITSTDEMLQELSNLKR